MAHSRNVEGLRNNAQKKREKSFKKVEEGIQSLIREQKRINFNTVAQASGVSKAWLYKEPEVKARIEYLRDQSSEKKSLPAKQKSSDKSKDSIIKTLKAKIKKVEAENKSLKSQMETVYGQLLQQKELQQKLERLEAENAQLKDRLYSSIADSPSKEDKVILPDSKISERINHELDSLGINPSSTLRKAIRNTSEQTVLTAIEAFKQQIDSDKIKSPQAWLLKAINDAWEPNEAMGEKQSNHTFEDWYELARQLGKIVSRRQEDGQWFVQENTGEWHSYNDFSEVWTYEYLKIRIDKN